ncbi:MAG: CRISPR-associated protein Cas4 [Clostridiaceae bacterium]|jgi:CRISPR-associated exonuclease Cas4|nr:CRISPR-associated protein Cas4 [Clostridiaceae bacterium]
MKVTGYLYGYYFLCKRKVWFAARQLNMENGSELVAFGKLIDENTYKREEHGIVIEDIANIDYLKKHAVHEVKKSDKQLDSAIAQVKFYLYHLHVRGVCGMDGKIDIPLQKKTVDVTLTESDIAEIPEIIKEIERIMDGAPPPVVETKICKACAYYDLCMI